MAGGEIIHAPLNCAGADISLRLYSISSLHEILLLISIRRMCSSKIDRLALIFDCMI